MQAGRYVATANDEQRCDATNFPCHESVMTTPDMLAIGRNMPITVERITLSDPNRYDSRIMGYVHMRYLVIEDIKGVLLKVGEVLLIRMISEGEAVAYQVTVKKTNSDPVLYMTSFPEKVESVQLRASERIKAFIPVEIKADAEDSPRLTDAMMLDISAGGCLFSCRKALEEKRSVLIEFCLPGSQAMIQLVGRILGVGARNAVYAHRVKFSAEERNDLSRSVIKSWIEEVSLYALD